jgi:predicted O-methyltransferase YrrM
MPRAIRAIQAETKIMGFQMASEPAVGALLKTLVASKPGGTMLELGTGTGLSTAWMLDGLCMEAKLVSVDNDKAVQAVAARHLGKNPQLTLCCTDAGEFLDALEPMQFDLIFADAWPGKYSHLERTLSLLREGGIYVVDDLLPQPNWPNGHQRNVDDFIKHITAKPGFETTFMGWATGVLIASRIG